MTSTTTPSPEWLALPLPRQLVLENFSLYRNRRRIDVTFDDGVFCLAGANGLGKSTFLTTLNYAVTGVAADPDRKFGSLVEFYRFTQPYAVAYYSGRIADIDRDLAFVRITMSVGDHEYELERGFFEQESLRYLQITGPDGIVYGHDDADSDSDRNAAYKQQVLIDSGLAQFEQLVFLQHFLLTFDERRRLLLWDEQTIEQALLLAFGVSPEQARRADDWRRKAERAESQARNLQYQATTARQRMADLRRRITPDAEDEADRDHSYERVLRETNELERQMERLRREESTAQLAEAEAQAVLVSAEQAYEEAFSRLLQPSPREHPLVLQSLQSDTCAVCSTDGAAARLTAVLDVHTCPLCGTQLPAPAEEEPQDLETLDAALAQARTHAAAIARRREELQNQRGVLDEQLQSLDADRRDVDAVKASEARGLTEGAVRGLLMQYENEARDATERRNAWRTKRDEYRRLLTPVARELAQRYAAAEERFVPRFTALAHRFLGLDVEVYLQQRAGRPALVVAVEGSERRSYDQMSESQRYFLDIALRMALVQHIGDGQRVGCLYVDTPEGSLDISYEARAGDMFADFVEGGDRLIMTANINTSRLLQALAAACGPERMQIVRMMDWTRLSDVQAEGEPLFEEALDELQQALTGSPRAT